MKSKLRLKQLLAAVACGASMAGTILYACDYETYKTATNPCHTGPICVSNIPYQNNNNVWVCNDARTVPTYYHTECKGSGETAVNCNGELAPCYRAITCQVMIVNGNRVCRNNAEYGDISNTERKVQNNCN